MMNLTEENIISCAKTYVHKLLSEECSGHDDLHVLRVFYNAKILQEKEGGNLFIIALASLLHDVDDYKLFPENKNYENTRNFLNENRVPLEIQEQVIKIISQVSFKGNDSVTPDTLEGQIVQDADRLDALGAIGIARCFAYGGSKQRKIYDPEEQITSDLNELEYRNQQTSSIAHFYKKLLLLKDLMNTKTGKDMANKRHQFLVDFLDEFYDEILEK